MSDTDEQTIVINDLLSFISCKMKLFPREKFLKCLRNFYPESAAMEAEKTLVTSLPDIAVFKKVNKKEKDPYAKLYDTFAVIPDDELPTFVCRNLNNVPQLEADDAEGQEVDDDSEELINEQKFIKAQISEISSVVYQLKDQIQLLAAQRSKNKSLQDLRKRAYSSAKEKPKGIASKKAKPPPKHAQKKGLAYLQTLIDQEEEEKVKRLSVKQEPTDSFSDYDEIDNDDDDEGADESHEEDDDETTLHLIANRRQRALVKNAEAEVLNGNRSASQNRIIFSTSSAVKRKAESSGTLRRNSRQKRTSINTEEETLSDEEGDEDELEYQEMGDDDEDDDDVEDGDTEEDNEQGASKRRKKSGYHNKTHIQVEEVYDENVGSFSVYKCSLCNFSTNDEAAIERHDCPQIYCGTEDDDVTTFKYFCFECKFRSNSKALYKKHLLKHPQSFSCPICPEKIEDPEDWTSHVVDCIEHNGLPVDDYICTVCQVIYASPSAIRVHKSNHELNKPYECLVCKFRFRTAEKLDSHFRLHQSRGYKCPFCFYVHKNKYTFMTHLRSHTGETPFACSLCEYRSTSLTAVNVHMLIHTNRKDFECDVCHSRFKSGHKLNFHKKLHEKGGDHKCPECDKSFKTAWLMTVHHSAVHISAQPFPCPLCDFTTETTSELKIHMETHEKLKIYECSLCPYRTNYKNQLDTHMKKTHLGLTDP